MNRRQKPGRSDVRGHDTEKDPFEMYLEDALGRCYEDVLDETLPLVIAELAEQLKSKIKDLDADDVD